MNVSATYRCGACGKVASTVTLAPPGQPDPRLTPEPPSVPPGISTLFSSVHPDHAQLAISGGPVSVTLSILPRPEVAAALESGDPAALYSLDSEYAPFWCPDCRLSYCADHYQATTLYDDGFFDCIMGTCPQGHERELED